MLNDVLNMLIGMFASILDLFEDVIGGLGAWDIILGGFLIYSIFRLLLIPILGGVIHAGQSDIVKKVRSNNSKKNSNNKWGEVKE